LRPPCAPAIRAFPGQCRMADPVRHLPQPDQGRRHASRAVPRQSPRRDHPPPADRRRRPHRPPRPRPHHRAPTRGLAPRARMDDPVPGRLRSARRRGLTSPDPVTARQALAAARQHLPPAEEPDKPPNRSAAGNLRPEIASRSSPAEALAARQRQNLRG
jgi:hypothetical protein